MPCVTKNFERFFIIFVWHNQSSSCSFSEACIIKSNVILEVGVEWSSFSNSTKESSCWVVSIIRSVSSQVKLVFKRFAAVLQKFNRFVSGKVRTCKVEFINAVDILCWPVILFKGNVIGTNIFRKFLLYWTIKATHNFV